MKAKNIAILLFSAVIGCAVAKTYSNRQDDDQKISNVKRERKVGVKENVKSETEAAESSVAETVNAENVKPSYMEYASLQRSGVVGLYGGNSIDNPEDNIFEVSIPSTLSSNDKVVLSYDVEGVAGASGVALSINDRTALGGMIAYSSDKVTTVSEEIDAAWLVKGKNRFMFALPDSANYGYKISNLKVAVKSDAANGNVVATASAIDGQVYVKGFVKNAKAKFVNIAGKEYELTHGAFEALISGDDKTVSITCGNESKTLDVTTVPGCTASTRLMCSNKAEKQTQKEFSLAKKENNKVQDVAATLNVDSGVVKHDMKITMTNLRHKDLPALDLGMTNVTDGVEGYRFLPHGTHFDGDGAVVSLKYDRTKIPSGYTENDIRTYYFDLDTKHWVALKRDTIDKENNLIVSHTNHFTDMINGVIKAPESPETQGFTPTMMSDLKLADPTAKIQSIEPPTANNRGSANLSYSFEMPPARNGMQPSLGIQYNSDGGSGLLGEGWDLSVPTISVETRWGVPRYISDVESETYNMDGSMLVLENGGVNYLAHRATNQIKRSEVKRTDGAVIFHPRKENSFSKIERFGDTPSEYTWVVTDKSGMKYYYGMKDADGNMKGVLAGPKGIAEWKLVRIQEVHGDWIEYEYEEEDDAVSSNVIAKTLYLSKITAGNVGEKAHTEVVVNKDIRKRKIQRMGNYGFLVSNPYLLKSVEIKYEDKVLRSYEFKYNHQAPFLADLLEKIIHKDANGDVVSENNMKYHDAIDGNGISFNTNLTPQITETKNRTLDVFGKDEYQILNRGVRMLGGTTSNTFSFNAYGGVGPTGNPVLKSLTVGGNFSYSHVTNHGVVSFTDIDGDGLADKVYKAKNCTLYYQPYLPDLKSFGKEIEINGISEISESTSSTITYGGNANAIGGIVAGISKGNVDSETTTYFSDVNGDGLVDLVDGSKVYFNRLVEDANKTNGDRKIAMFAEGSNVTAIAPATPNPIVSSFDALKNRDTEGIEKEKERLEEKQKTKIENSPMHDVIRVWEAPYAGSVSVSGNPIFAGTDNSDGAVVSVQYKNKYILDPVVLSKNNTTASLSKTLTVSKGDKIYFRVQSGKEIDSNGEGDIVNWQPVVSYSDAKYQINDPNGLSLAEYPSVGGFMLSSSSEGVIDADVDIAKRKPATLKLKLNKEVTTDDVKVVVILHNEESYEVLSSDGKTYESKENNDYRKVNVVTYDLPAAQTISDDKSISLDEYVYQSAEHPLKYISCRVESSTNIDWSKVSLSAIVEYEKSGDDDNITSLGVPVFIGAYTSNGYFGGWKTSYGENIEDETSYTVKVSETEEEERTISKADLIQKLELTPKINFETSGLNVSAFRMTFKNEAGDLLGNITLNYADGAFSAIKISDYPFLMDWIAQENPEKLWIEYYADLSENDNNEDDTDPSFKVNSSGWTIEAYEFTEIEKTGTDEAGNEVTYTETVKNQIYESSINGLNVVSNRLNQSFGPMYRGWGQFAYNAAVDRYKQKMDETRLGLSAYNDMKDGYDPEHPESFEYDKDKQAFIVLQPDFINNTWNGQASYKSGKDIIINGVSKDLMIAARQGEQDVKVVDPFANINSGSISGGYGIGFPILSESSSKTKQYGALGVTANDSDGDSKTTQSFMDMNGDGYPDLIKGKEIFYTNQTGGLNGGTQYFKDIDLSDCGTSNGTSYGSGNGAIHALPSLVKAIKGSHNNNTNAQEKSAEKSRANFSINVSAGSNDESTERTKLDMNGDGLLDIVSLNGGVKVMLNLGYGFTPEIEWGGSFIREGSSTDIGIGGGVDICGSSYSAGLNISGATSDVDKDLVDANGDGLPDLLTVDTKKKKGTVRLNTGFGFGEEISIDKIPSIGTSTSLNGSINGNATVGFVVWLVRISVSGGAAAGTGLSGEELSLRDFDGDGYPDVVTSGSKNSIEVALSNIGATNKLKAVTTPFGGTYELEYKHSIPTQQHPGGKWVMSKLTVKDNVRSISDCPSIVSVFEYNGGKRDRRERDFYGFAEVRTKRMNGNDVESQIVQNYDVTNYYSAGTAIGSYVCDADQKQFFSKETSKLNMYDVSGKGNVTNGREVSATASFDENGRYFVAPFESTTKRFEEDSEITTNIVENTYGDFGNLTQYKYTDGITNKSYTTTITYKDYDEETGVFGLPTEVKVESDGNPMRHVTAEYDGSGYNPTSMTKMTQYLDKNTTASVEFKYDTLGNIIEKIMPKANDESNLMKESMKYTYEYDKKHRMYPTRVTDGFGYRSDMFNYDYRYGIPLSVKDMNGFTTEYEIDDLGRVTKVTAPNELSSGAPYTILYHYGDVDSLRYARTYHYDPQHPKDPMITASIVDGLGRGYQVKKNAEVDGERQMIVSGLTKFDALGREIAHYAPSICDINDFGFSVDKTPKQLDEIKYDLFDRPVEQTAFSEYSDAYTTYTSYEIEDGKLKTHVMDKNGKDNILSVNTYTDGSEHTLKTVKNHKKGGEPATTEFIYDGIGQLLSVKDPANKFTTYTYDMAGRKLSVDNLSAGKTTFTYDNLGNVLTKTTGKGDVVTYKYEYNRLVEQIYGNDKWKNNVKYTYGGVDAKHNRVGRLALVEDGSGAQEYFYGKMGEVEKIRRTIIIPGVDVATYTTESKYDSWNRIQEMIYPDGEKIKYYYNFGGQLERILGQKNYICTYIDEIKYDKYEQRSFIRYGNGTETNYAYDPVNSRLHTMTVSNEKSKAEGAKGLFLNNLYTYDAAGNITGVANSSALNSGIGGTMTHEYTYDDWYRLETAHGVFESADKAKRAEYSLTMRYDNLYNITSKKMTMTQTNLQFVGKLSAGHEFNYNYSNDNPMQLASVETKQYNVDGEVSDVDAKLSDNKRTQNYEFDANGNMTSVSVAPNEQQNSEVAEQKDVLKSFLWDEENRLLAVNNNGSVSCYFYDAAGERTVKLTSETEMVHVNGKKVGGNANICKFIAYVSPYFVVSNGGAYTKHIYAASQRIASKLGNIDGFGADPRRVEQAGGKKYDDNQSGTIKARFEALNIDYSDGNGKKDDEEYEPTMDSEEKENLVFFYHPDHLGSTSYVTDADGNIAQHVEYIPYGEVFVEERNNSFSTNYLFNAKELDNETGLYYYGARYLDPTGGMWLSVDPMWEKYAGMSPYNYCAGNPVKLVDPDGREGIVVSGSPGDHDNKTHFLVNGLDRAMSAKKHVKTSGESVTWLIYNDSKKGFKEEDLVKYKAKAKEAKINVKIVDNVKDLISYINNKDGDKAPRDKDKISSFYYVGHATPGDLDVGYQGSGEDFDPSDLKSDAFAKGCHVNVNGGCRTAVSDNYIIYEEKSVVDQFADILDKTSTIYGSDVRVYYSGGKMSDQQLLKHNNGTLVKRNGKR